MRHAASQTDRRRRAAATKDIQRRGRPSSQHLCVGHMCIVRLIIIDSSTRKLKNMCAIKLFFCLSAPLPLLSFNQAILSKSFGMFAENVTCHHISSHPLLQILKDQEGLTCQQKKDAGSVFRGKSLESAVRCPCCTLSRRNAKSPTRCKEPSVTMGAAVEHSPKSNYLVAHVFQDTRPGVKP